MLRSDIGVIFEFDSSVVTLQLLLTLYQLSFWKDYHYQFWMRTFSFLVKKSSLVKSVEIHSFDFGIMNNTSDNTVSISLEIFIYFCCEK